MRSTKLFIIILIFGFLLGCIHNKYRANIGGETDEHGCLIGAGYQWCESKQKCIRIWEEDCP